MVAGEADRAFVAPEQPQHGDRLFEGGDGFAGGAAGPAVGGDRRPDRAGPQAEVDAAAREQVEGAAPFARTAGGHNGRLATSGNSPMRLVRAASTASSVIVSWIPDEVEAEPLGEQDVVDDRRGVSGHGLREEAEPHRQATVGPRSSACSIDATSVPHGRTRPVPPTPLDRSDRDTGAAGSAVMSRSRTVIDPTVTSTSYEAR